MKKFREPPTIILLLVVSFASVLAVLFAPALPQMAKAMGISSNEAQIILSVYLVGYAFGVLPYGPLSNRFGRKPALFIGASIALLGSFMAIFAAEMSLYWLMILGRIITALGSAAGLKVVFTIIADVFHKEAAAKKLSLLVLAFATTPGLGIALGGFLTEQLGWKSCFYFMAFYCCLMLFLVSFLPETSQNHGSEPLNGEKIQKSLFRVFKNRTVVFSGLMMGCGASTIYLFATIAPFIGISKIGLSPEQYGLFNFIPPMGMIVGSYWSRYLADRWIIMRTIHLGICIAFFSSVTMLFLFLSGCLNAWTLFLPMPCMQVGFTLVYSNASLAAMSHTEDKSNASAVMHFVNLGFVVFSLFSIEAIPFHEPFLLPLAFTLLAAALFGLKRNLEY